MSCWTICNFLPWSSLVRSAPSICLAPRRPSDPVSCTKSRAWRSWRSWWAWGMCSPPQGGRTGRSRMPATVQSPQTHPGTGPAVAACHPPLHHCLLLRPFPSWCVRWRFRSPWRSTSVRYYICDITSLVVSCVATTSALQRLGVQLKMPRCVCQFLLDSWSTFLLFLFSLQSYERALRLCTSRPRPGTSKSKDISFWRCFFNFAGDKDGILIIIY